MKKKAADNLLKLCEDIYLRLAEWEIDDLCGGIELERIEVELENKILEAGGKLPDQG